MVTPNSTRRNSSGSRNIRLREDKMRANKKVKMRKSIRYFYLTSSILILVCSSVYLLKTLVSAENYSVRNEEIYSYKNSFNYDYKVNIMKNPYIEESYLEMKEEAYVTDLIQSIDLNLNYKYDANVESNVEYEYSVKGFLEATYTKDSEVQKVWEKEYSLLDTKKETKNTDIINIKENLKLDLRDENNLVKRFEQEMGMNIDAKYIVILEIKTNTNVEGEKVSNKYISSVNIDLAEKTTKVKGENNKEDKKYISKQVEEQVEFNVVSIIIALALDVLAIIIIRYIYSRTSSTNRIRNEYRQELNRILRLCQDKIVQVNTQYDMKNERIVDVKDFGEIIKVSEELFKPILYWSAKDREEAWFSVVSNHVTYRYILTK